MGGPGGNSLAVAARTERLIAVGMHELSLHPDGPTLLIGELNAEGCHVTFHNCQRARSRNHLLGVVVADINRNAQVHKSGARHDNIDGLIHEVDVMKSVDCDRLKSVVICRIEDEAGGGRADSAWVTTCDGHRGIVWRLVRQSNRNGSAVAF